MVVITNPVRLGLLRVIARCCNRPQLGPAALALAAFACRPVPASGENPGRGELEAAPGARLTASARPLASAHTPNEGMDAGLVAQNARLAPLAGAEPIIALEVEGFRPAAIALPLGATGKRPVVVALHGNYDRPEWQCEVWSEITQGYAFVVCPRGIPRSDAPKSEDRWEYGGLPQTERELTAALDALSKRYPDYVDLDRAVYTGFSLGAILGKSIASKRPGTFARAVFTEGGFEAWTVARAKQYVEAGVGRVLFACGQPSCVVASKSAARVLEKQGVPTRVVSGGKIGHAYDGPVARAIAAEWGWLVEGDPRWDAAVRK